MTESLLPLLCERDQYYPAVLLTAHTLDISLLYQVIHCNGQGAHSHIQRPGYCGHIFLLPDPHCIHNVHIIYRNIFILRRNQRPLFQIQNLIKQIYKHIIDRLIMVHPVLPLSHISYCVRSQQPLSLIIHYITLPYKAFLGIFYLKIQLVNTSFFQ